MKDQELEIKYFIANLPALEERVRSLGGELVQPRVFETNLRFDGPDGELARSARVLRLRQDSVARMTYKGPAESREGVRVRRELEFEVSDFETARLVLDALGYVVSMAYEKYRTTYDLGQVHVVMDEMPYGNFAEIEGPDPGAIQAVSERLGLDWERRVPESYTMLFERLKAKLGLPFRDLSFANFRTIKVIPSDLNVLPAD